MQTRHHLPPPARDAARRNPPWPSCFPAARTLFAFLSLLTWLAAAPVQAAEESTSTTNEMDKAACERQLRIIHQAIEQYRSEHRGVPPDKLSDLIPEYLHDPKSLTCPFVAKRGGLRTWKKRFRELTPDSHTSYGYEIPPVFIDYQLWRGLPKKTWREMKEQMQKHLEQFGPVVPIVRCHDHRPWLNLTTTGKIYESGHYWERNFTTNDDLLTLANLFSTPAGPAPGPADFPPRDPGATARQLDLTPYYNATLTNDWLGLNGSNLASLPSGLQELDGIRFDIRGVLQFAGAEIPSRFPFPTRVDGIPVRQRCRRIHFLHALTSDYRNGSLQATYRFKFANGHTEQFPLLCDEQIGDWWVEPENPVPPPGATIAWIGQNEATRAYQKAVCLYHTIWDNPRPDAEIDTLSFDLRPKQFLAGAFIISITLE